MYKKISLNTLILLLVLLSSCESQKTQQSKNSVQIEGLDLDKILKINDSAINVEAEDTSEYATLFVVIADTSPDYAMLHQKMFDLHQKLNIPIDTMGRYYNESKNLIALPDNDEDEMYAGDYFPRRFPSENLSLEYLDFYQLGAREKTIALVVGLYDTEENADSILAVLKNIENKSFKVKAEIYMGCMH
ncbi:MAG: hypothetical protein FNNCIFGK_02203 [Bacteroidia bacterium]|nr:MAG: hypothetical protein UZ10_BCD003001483 [Bacteroidetes bacterium OLB10]MBV6454925.1 hypothetical protein [Bacteroidia bacterium]MBX3106770.1 hypothetical protein [Bacteroidota bacterium]MCB0849582.1 hypothetical protein [Bacteroidota bacterium]MCW5932617.1 hypothetical protein [Bacteroidota bacterium]